MIVNTAKSPRVMKNAPDSKGIEMKFKSLVAILAVTGLVATSLIGAEEDAKKKKANRKEQMAKILKETKCPLSGQRISRQKDNFSKFLGPTGVRKRIYGKNAAERCGRHPRGCLI